MATFKVSKRFFLSVLMAVTLIGLFGAQGTAAAHPVDSGTIGSCSVFPTDNPWNRDITNDPVDPNSANYVASVGATTNLHPDFGSNPTYGIPYITVPGTQPKVPMTFTAYASESDPGPYPFPANAPVEAGSDGHSLVIDRDHCILYELGRAQYNGSGWTAAGGAVFNLNSNKLRPDTWTSADAAGLPIFPGLARLYEATHGPITHALRFTINASQDRFIHPATHKASSDSNPNLPPMGLRFRLKASFDLSGFTGESKVILTALKHYGMFVADNGSDWYISGETNPNWDDNDLDQIKTVPGGAFEVVQSVQNAPPTDGIGVFRPSTHTFYLKNTSAPGGVDRALVFGIGPNDYPVMGDWAGIGFDAVGVFNRNNGVFSLRDSLTPGTADHVFALGNAGDQPFAGRWSATATHDGVGVFRPTNGLIYLKNALSTGFADKVMVLGIPGDSGFAGDWNGDRVDSPGVFRPSKGNFYLSNKQSGTVFADIEMIFGTPGDLPFAGNWTGLAHDGVGYFRPSTRILYLKNNLTNGSPDISIAFGGVSDIPVAGHWQANLPPPSITSLLPSGLIVPGVSAPPSETTPVPSFDG